MVKHKRLPDNMKDFDLNGMFVIDRNTGEEIIYHDDREFNEFTGELITGDNDPDLFPSEWNNED